MDSSQLSDRDFTSLLQEPFKQHPGVAVENVTVGDLLHVNRRLLALVTTEGIGLPAAKSSVLHAVAFHLLGGYEANLPPPPPTSAEARSSPSYTATRTLTTEATRLEAKRASLAARAAKGAGGPAAAAAAQELAALLATPLDAKNCCLLRNAGDGTKGADPDPAPASPPLLPHAKAASGGDQSEPAAALPQQSPRRLTDAAAAAAGSALAARKRLSESETLLAQRAPATDGKRIRLGPDPGFDLWRKEQAEGSWAFGRAHQKATAFCHFRDAVPVVPPVVDAQTPGAWFSPIEGCLTTRRPVRAIPTSDGRFWINGT